MEWLIPLLVAGLGLVFGSFITCMSYRLPREEDLVRKPSYCPNCDAVLAVRDLFPLFSWLASRGKCRHCNAAVSLRYPLTELSTAALFLLVYMQFGLTLQTAILCLMVVALMVMVVVDLEHFIMPDSTQVALLILAVCYHYVCGTPGDELVIATGLMAAFGLTLHFGYSALRGRTMLGYGDVKFFTIAGVWLGLWPIVSFLLLAGVLGVVLGILWRLLGRGELFPFGPALALSLFLCVIYPQQTNILYYIN